MAMNVRRIVTGHNGAGKAVIKIHSGPSGNLETGRQSIVSMKPAGCLGKACFFGMRRLV